MAGTVVTADMVDTVATVRVKHAPERLALIAKEPDVRRVAAASRHRGWACIRPSA